MQQGCLAPGHYVLDSAYKAKIADSEAPGKSDTARVLQGFEQILMSAKHWMKHMAWSEGYTVQSDRS